MNYREIIIEKIREYLSVLASVISSDSINNKTQPILNPVLEGDKLSFSYLDRKNNLHSVKVTVNGSQLKGEDKGGSTFTEITGKRR